MRIDEQGRYILSIRFYLAFTFHILLYKGQPVFPFCLLSSSCISFLLFSICISSSHSLSYFYSFFFFFLFVSSSLPHVYTVSCLPPTRFLSTFFFSSYPASIYLRPTPFHNFYSFRFFTVFFFPFGPSCCFQCSILRDSSHL